MNLNQEKSSAISFSENVTHEYNKMKNKIREELRNTDTNVFSHLVNKAQSLREGYIKEIASERLDTKELQDFNRFCVISPVDVYQMMDGIPIKNAYLNPDEYLELISQVKNPRDRLILSAPYIGARQKSWERLRRLKPSDWKDGEIYFGDIDKWVRCPLDMSKIISDCEETSKYFVDTAKRSSFDLIDNGTVLKKFDAVVRKYDPDDESQDEEVSSGHERALYMNYLRSAKQAKMRLNGRPNVIRNMGILSYLNQFVANDEDDWNEIMNNHMDDVCAVFDVTERTVKQVVKELDEYIKGRKGAIK